MDTYDAKNGAPYSKHVVNINLSIINYDYYDKLLSIFLWSVNSIVDSNSHFSMQAIKKAILFGKCFFVILNHLFN